MSGADEPSERQSGWTAQEVRRLKERQFELALALADLNVSAMQIQTLVLLLRSGGDADKVNERSPTNGSGRHEHSVHRMVVTAWIRESRGWSGTSQISRLCSPDLSRR
jgi:hypothetical protein